MSYVLEGATLHPKMSSPSASTRDVDSSPVGSVSTRFTRSITLNPEYRVNREGRRREGNVGAWLVFVKSEVVGKYALVRGGNVAGTWRQGGGGERVLTNMQGRNRKITDLGIRLYHGRPRHPYNAQAEYAGYSLTMRTWLPTSTRRLRYSASRMKSELHPTKNHM